MRRHQGKLIVIGLVAAIWTVYAQTASFEFVSFDDHRYLLENPTVRDGWTIDGLISAWTTPYFSNFHPITTMSWMLDAEIFGLTSGPFHVTNVIWHTVNVLLLFVLLKTLTGAPLRSAAVAFLLAVHPQHVESVAWVSSRKDLLFLFFALLSLLSWTKYCANGKRSWFVGALLFYLLSLLSKQMLVTLPCLLLVLDYWPLRRLAWRAWRTPETTKVESKQETASADDGNQENHRTVGRLVLEKIPFLLVGIVFSIIIFLVQKESGSMGSGPTLPLDWRLSNVVIGYAEYLWHAIRPTSLAVLYPLAGKPPSATFVAGAVSLLIAVSAIAWRMRRAEPYFVVGWLWFLGTLFPVSGIVKIGSHRIADRYTYFPMIGIYIAVVWLLAHFSQSQVRIRKCLPPLCIVTGLVLMVAAFQQVGVWKNSATLYKHALNVTGRNLNILVNLGWDHFKSGKNEDAATVFQTVANDFPDNNHALGHCAQFAAETGDISRSLQLFRQAQSLDANNPRVNYNAAGVKRSVGDLTGALADYDRVISQGSDVSLAADSLTNAGSILFEQGETKRAEDYLKRALALNASPATSSRAQTNLGVLSAASGKMTAAYTAFQNAVSLDEQNGVAWFYLGRILLQQGRNRDGMTAINMAVSVDPSLQKDRDQLMGTAPNAPANKP